MSALEVTVVGAQNLPNVELVSKSDPYTIVQFQGTKYKTKVIDNELNPTWNEKFLFDLGGQPLAASDQINILVKDFEKIGPDRFLGQADVPLKDLVSGKRELQLNVGLFDSNKRPTAATINISLKYNAPRSATNMQDDIDAGGGAGTVVGATDLEGDDDDGEEDEEDGAQPDGAAGGKKAQRRRRKQAKGSKRRARSGKYSNKAQDFQIRVKIVEARQLQGANISPICKLTCWNQTKETRVKTSTNSPFWNETFFFNFYVSPAELFDELISFGVYNSRRLRSDALIGSFKFDIGLMYEEEKHCLMNKWLLLCDPDDPMAGAKGYLKICAVVLGPGDEAPSFKSTSDEEEDIEANLLRPAGVQLRPATFILRLYKGEDLPRMDSDALQTIKKVFTGESQKELVDPYLVFQFAGKEVKSTTKYCSDHPDWNEELKIGLQFPSMCERIKLQLFDWDRLTKDDAIGMGSLRLQGLGCSRDDSGFLPTFGPCFINMYGSPREYSDLPDKFEALNRGKGEGVAYRGRVLVELQTILGEASCEEVVPASQDTIMRAQKFLRRRKYRLHAAFLSASMVTAVDAPVEFEVSIGNYGNKLDENVPPCSSTTQPTNAVFDGSHYHFLPWAHSKPCTVVESHWEDISFRLYTINFLLKIVDRLDNNIEKIRVAMKANLPEEEQAQFVISAFDELILQCHKDVPVWEPGQSAENELDLNMRALRENDLKNIRKDALQIREEATSVDQALTELENFLNQLKNLAIEPQNSMPDVVIWMISGEKRKAYYRIPAYEVLYAKNEDYMGRFCGAVQTINLKIPSLKDEEGEELERLIPAQLRVKIWLGQDKDEQEWHKMQVEGELAILAESYENQASLVGKWCTRGPMMTRPAWSDSSGRVELKKELLKPPEGWDWDGDWYVSPELSLFYDKDAGRNTYLEDVYMNETRIPGGNWSPSSQQFTDVKGDPCPHMQDVQCPEGWEWTDDWQIDFNRPCDEDGWEYTVEVSMGGYVPVEKMYHMCRRRRYVRPRELRDQALAKKEETSKKKEREKLISAPGDDHWEYAPLFELKFHAKEHKMDMVRRRRWHRKMRPLKPGAPCFFTLGPGTKEEAAKESKDESEKAALAAPRMFLAFKKSRRWQLRAYVYQARDLLAGDQTGLSDPYVRVVFLNQSQATERIDKTLCPTWDETLIFNRVDIHGDPNGLVETPPVVVAEVFDYDQMGEDEFLGRCQVTPLVKLHPDDPRRPVLQWYPITKGKREAGELLAAFELFLVEGKEPPFTPSRRGNLFTVPSGVRPVMQRTGIEVLAWGVRNMRKFQLANVTSPSIEFEIGGYVLNSEVIKNTNRNPNFTNPVLFLDVLLPREELYMPPMNIRVRDHRQFGRKPMVGIHVLKTMDVYRYPPLTEEIDPLRDFPGLGISVAPGDHADVIIEMPPGTEGNVPPGGDPTAPPTKHKAKEPSITSIESQEIPTTPATKKKWAFFGRKKKKPDTMKARMFNVNFFRKDDGSKVDLTQLDEDIDWWSKYYASMGEWTKCRKYKEMGYDVIKIYNCELEKAENHNGFTDFCSTFLLSRGKNLEDDDPNVVGEFKGSFRVYPLPEDRAMSLPVRYMDRCIPPSDPIECTIRVYVIKAVDLQPNDPSGLADPYVEVVLGKKKLSSKDEYIPNCLNPVFGRMFELKCTLPIQKDIEIRIKDYDLLSSDDVIGQTSIDLENRFLSKYRATCGLPQTYCISGPNQWRDVQKPKEILLEFCEKYRLPIPEYEGTQILRINQRVFSLPELEKGRPPNPHYGPCDERLALHVLNRLPLVKEHVETRPLYSPLQPNIEQGKLQMWVDIHPIPLGLPGPAFPVQPRKPKNYILRIIIWNTKDVILEETSITGEKMSDIYVKGWLAGIDERQETDVHYRSLDGEGNFNWRFVFPFDYLPAENTMIVKRKEHFWSLDETELRLPCSLVIQIWDNDKFSADDFLGTLELNLSHMPAPAKKSRQCDLNQLPAFGGDPKMISLFECRRAYGYWPCYNDETGKAELTGKVEMELELLTAEEAEQKPSGLGRDEPNENPHLDPPKRPDTSFFWFTSPWKTFKHIIWKNFKWYFIGGIVIILVGLLIALFIYAIPGLTARKMVGV